MRGAFFLRSDCDKGQQSDASKCYVATCPTGKPDGYRSCTCWAYQTCTAEVHCAVKSGEALPPNCSRAAAIWSPQNSSQEFYSWNPRGSNCLNATINCVAAMEYYCPRGGSSGGGSGGEAACIKCGMGPHRAAFLAANCTDESIAQVCRGNTAGSKSSSGTIHAIDSDSSTAEVPGPQPRAAAATTQQLPGVVSSPARDDSSEELRRARQENAALEERVRVLEEQMQKVLLLLASAAGGGGGGGGGGV